MRNTLGYYCERRSQETNFSSYYLEMHRNQLLLNGSEFISSSLDLPIKPCYSILVVSFAESDRDSGSFCKSFLHPTLQQDHMTTHCTNTTSEEEH